MAMNSGSDERKCPECQRSKSKECREGHKVYQEMNTYSVDAIIHDVWCNHDGDDRGVPFQGDVVLEHTINALLRGRPGYARQQPYG